MSQNNNSSKSNPTQTISKKDDSKPVIVYNNYINIEPVMAKHLEVQVRGDVNKALGAFRAILQKEKILSYYKEHQAYEKPSDKKRRKKNESIRKRMELESKQSKYDDYIE